MDILRMIMKDRIFGEAGKQVIIEEYLKGERITVTAITDGKTILPISTLSVHRHMSHRDISFLSSGMSAYSLPAHIPKDREELIMARIMKPFFKALHAEGIQYKGFISADLTLAEDRLSLFDINCWFGDLDAQTILPRLSTDFTEIALAAAEGRLSDIEIKNKQVASCCIELLQKDQSLALKKKGIIKGLDTVKTMEDTFVFHENTSFQNADIIPSGGRVMSLVATGPDLKTAREKVTHAAEMIQFSGMHYDIDIEK